MSTASLSQSRGPSSSPSPATLHQLRCENAMLLKEKQFLTQAVASGPSTSARVNSVRYNADAVELKLLMAYQMASELHDAEGCRAAEVQMQQRVAEMATKVNKLRQLLEMVQKDVQEVLEASGGWERQAAA
ncbi:conserved hypothetical protein [Leishmania braziliensis MHOM/BR/75/M2904]|uniref:Uncharacterized protein n=2 Tax=Leishmania braziliensis TaxID=5660 RepID=A4HPP9_LEIBR|nr:conserved hypothetical protein [Leishmania braziliensis MHOM/BR/75/M2904]KAI5691445.1 hypothetical protein MNV84_08161 [Leishmania braziliensis]CAJ2481754.1 unnamed protein product [Leishmania braziliensis]CAJ2482155.1 unnamed protein product [Leishmania braziliensis]CAM44157.1 conserved hypothetical protein [Leishmania braziliensis MHOM/BR/75/M2904]SYZ70230.1 hypothetical_protein [Leishmania braziliensis MHOM/BR/75/M2904]